MKLITTLEHDSSNSYPDSVTLEACNTGRGNFIAIHLESPEREIWISRQDLKKALSLFDDTND